MTGLREFDRLEAERLHRMQRCFDADRPARDEVRAAMQRWRSTQTQASRTIRLRASWAIAGVLLLSGGAMAATRIAQLPSFRSFLSWPKTPGPAAAPSKLGAGRYYVERAGRRVEYEQPAELKLAPGEHAVLVVKEIKTEFVGPGVARVRPEETSGGWVSQFEPQGWAPVVPATAPISTTNHEAAPVRSTPSIDVPARVAPVRTTEPIVPKSAAAERREASIGTALPAAALEGAWSRAAAAMRRGDDIAASSALSEISRSADPPARDAALLAQAQLDLAAGRNDRAVPLLNRLAQFGATAFVRQRAREILVSGR